jgi:hypothetical protein
MTQNRGNARRWGNVASDSSGTLLPMLIGGLVLIVIAMVMVAVFT